MMKSIRLIIILSLLTGISCRHNQTNRQDKYVLLSEENLQDKIKGGWAGQVIGVSYGGPYEFAFLGTYIQDYQKLIWKPGFIKENMIHNPGLYDDLYMDLIFMNVIEKYGTDISADSFANAFANANFKLWHANQSARYNVLHGIKPPASGNYKNNPHADDIDFQIESDFAGLMSPAMPQTAAQIDDKVGHIMCYGDGWYGGVFVSTLYTLAFSNASLKEMIKTALLSIPVQSRFYQCIADVIHWHDQYADWHDTWFALQKKWAEDIGCPDGVYNPFDIDAKLNAAYVVIALLYGNEDLNKSMEIAARCGQDADCNPSTVAGILGTKLGYDHIPEIWKREIETAENIPFSNTSLSLSDAYKLSYKHAINNIIKNGGKIEGNTIRIKPQKLAPVRFEESFPAIIPKTLINTNIDELKDTSFSFNGCGIAIRGGAVSLHQSNPDYVFHMSVELDHQKTDTILLPVSFIKRRNDLYWNYELSEGKHTIRVRVLNPSRENAVRMNDYILYSKEK